MVGMNSSMLLLSQLNVTTQLLPSCPDIVQNILLIQTKCVFQGTRQNACIIVHDANEHSKE